MSFQLKNFILYLFTEQKFQLSALNNFINNVDAIEFVVIVETGYLQNKKYTFYCILGNFY